MSEPRLRSFDDKPVWRYVVLVLASVPLPAAIRGEDVLLMVKMTSPWRDLVTLLVSVPSLIRIVVKEDVPCIRDLRRARLAQGWPFSLSAVIQLVIRLRGLHVEQPALLGLCLLLVQVSHGTHAMPLANSFSASLLSKSRR